MHTEIAKLEFNVADLNVKIKDLGGDVRDLRDRMKAVETNLAHLPTKEFIIKVVTIGAGIIISVLTMITLIPRAMDAMKPQPIVIQGPASTTPTAAPIAPAPAVRPTTGVAKPVTPAKQGG